MSHAQRAVEHPRPVPAAARLSRRSGADDELLAKVMQLVIDLRAEARKAKNFATADAIRDGLGPTGIKLEDRAGGTEWTGGGERALDAVMKLLIELRQTARAEQGLRHRRRHPQPPRRHRHQARRPRRRHRVDDEPRPCASSASILASTSPATACSKSSAGRCGSSKPASSAARPRARSPARLQEIHDGVADVIASLKPEAMALEQLYSHYDRPTTAILMGHARGVIVLAAAAGGHRRCTTTRPRRSKKRSPATAAPPKSQMQDAIRRELRLPQAPEPPDVADALAIALCHAWSCSGQRSSADRGSRGWRLSATRMHSLATCRSRLSSTLDR